MEFKVSTSHFENIENEDVKNKLKDIYNLFLNESLKGNKVAFYYEDLNNNKLSFNENICFYAASTIKILVCLYLYELSEDGKVDLDEELLVTSEDLCDGTGIIKNQINDTKYTISKLIELCLVESDNTAYTKLVKYVGKDELINYGKNLGANHTLEGKDLFGIINCSDLLVYWKELIKYINSTKKGTVLREYLINPSTKLIKLDNYLRKYGSFDIAYHEAGYVDCENSYYLIVLTQINKEEYKEEFINKAANILNDINSIKK